MTSGHYTAVEPYRHRRSVATRPSRRERARGEHGGELATAREPPATRWLLLRWLAGPREIADFAVARQYSSVLRAQVAQRPRQPRRAPAGPAVGAVRERGGVVRRRAAAGRSSAQHRIILRTLLRVQLLLLRRLLRRLLLRLLLLPRLLRLLLLPRLLLLRRLLLLVLLCCC